MKNKMLCLLTLSFLLLFQNVATFANQKVALNQSNLKTLSAPQKRSRLNSVFYRDAYRKGNDLIVEVLIKGPSTIRRELSVNLKYGIEIGKYSVRNGVVYKYKVENMPFGFHDIVVDIVDRNHTPEKYKFYLMHKI